MLYGERAFALPFNRTVNVDNRIETESSFIEMIRGNSNHEGILGEMSKFMLTNGKGKTTCCCVLREDTSYFVLYVAFLCYTQWENGSHFMGTFQLCGLM